MLRRQRNREAAPSAPHIVSRHDQTTSKSIVRAKAEYCQQRNLHVRLLFGRSLPRGGPLANFDGDAIVQARVYSRDVHGLISAWGGEENDRTERGVA
jgi:hypothetical protein